MAKKITWQEAAIAYNKTIKILEDKEFSDKRKKEKIENMFLTLLGMLPDVGPLFSITGLIKSYTDNSSIFSQKIPLTLYGKTQTEKHTYIKAIKETLGASTFHKIDMKTAYVLTIMDGNGLVGTFNGKKIKFHIHFGDKLHPLNTDGTFEGTKKGYIKGQEGPRTLVETINGVEPREPKLEDIFEQSKSLGLELSPKAKLAIAVDLHEKQEKAHNAEIVNDPKSNIDDRIAAMDNLPDEKPLVKVAKNQDANWRLRVAAINRLTSVNAVLSIMPKENDPNYETIKLNAINRLHIVNEDDYILERQANAGNNNNLIKDANNPIRIVDYSSKKEGNHEGSKNDEGQENSGPYQKQGYEFFNMTNQSSKSNHSGEQTAEREKKSSSSDSQTGNYMFGKGEKDASDKRDWYAVDTDGDGTPDTSFPDQDKIFQGALDKIPDLKDSQDHKGDGGIKDKRKDDNYSFRKEDKEEKTEPNKEHGYESSSAGDNNTGSDNNQKNEEQGPPPIG